MIESLTLSQRQAVEYLESPLLVVAGPGAGKTRVLTEKVMHLVKNGYDPNRILVSTFTIKAADELKDRLRRELGDSVENMQISTIHSFCQKMLQSFPEYHNFGNIFTVLDDLDQFIYVNKNSWSYGLKEYWGYFRVADLVNFYNLCTENDVEPSSLIKELCSQDVDYLQIAIAKSYQLYLGNLLNPQNTKLDFALLQKEFLHLLKSNGVVLKHVREMFDYILIDEFQDTNPIQDSIIKLIAEPKFAITVVGDEDQSIYGFRGASVKNFRTFLKRYPHAKKIELEENFRSCQEIVSVVDKFIKPYRTFEKNLFTNNGSFTKPFLLENSSPEEEAKALASWIKKLVSEHNVKFEDIAILFKSVKFHAQEIIEELERQNIPIITIGDSSLLTQDEIRDMTVLLAFVNDFEPNEYQIKKHYNKNILKSEVLDLREETIKALDGDMDTTNLTESYDYDKLTRLNICKEDVEKLINLKNLRKLQKRNPVSQLRLFYKVLDATSFHYRLFKELNQEQGSSAHIKIRNLAKFSELIAKFEDNTNSREFKTLLYHISTIPENKLEDAASSEEEQAVKIMTIHQAKGLEFPAVILAGVNNRRYNSKNPEDSPLVDIPASLMLDKERFDRGEEKEFPE